MGKLFVIDGTDASGKQTQFERLEQRLQKENIDYRVASFPNYDSPSSSLVKMYLSGEFGEHAKEISPYIASTFYTVDRYATFKKGLEKYYNNGGIILADRYTTSNMIHQAGKIDNKKERKKFLEWLWDFEFNLYKLPVPTKVFFLDMPPQFAFKLMQNRKNKFANGAVKDIHERDKNHIIDTYMAACEISDKYGWAKIECVKNGKIRTVEEIHNDIYNILKNVI